MDRPPEFTFRSIQVRAKTVDEEARSIEAAIATETPVVEFDFDRFEFLPRVLLASGAKFPKNRQAPLLDNHNRRSTEDQIGSARRFVKNADEGTVDATLFFSAVAEDQFTKVREGHITDVSVGFEVIRQTHVPEGETQTIAGQEFDGPINVATEWRVREVSITPIGADEQAKMRGLRPEELPECPPEVRTGRGSADQPEKKEFQMDEQLRALLLERGMPQDLDDDQAQKWMIENREKVFAAESPAPPDREENRENSPGTISEERLAKIVDQAMRDRERRQTEFRAEVDDLLRLAGLAEDREFVGRCYEQPDVPAVRKAILDEKERRAQDVPASPVIHFGAGQTEKHRDLLSTALNVRTLQAIGVSREVQQRALPDEQRAQGWEQFRYASLVDLARECLMADGYRYRDLQGLSREQLAIAALGWPAKVGLRAGDGTAYHTTGSFAVITQDAVNKSMMLGFEEFPATWRGPMRQGTSVPDFKTIHRMQLGAVPNLPIWDGKSKPNNVSMADEEETYAVEARSAKLGFHYKLLVNDDMDVISRSPFKLGDAAARTVNAVAWTQITSNPTMRDSQKLFLETAAGDRKRSNLTTGAGKPTVANIQTLTDKMMQMRGINTPEGNESDDILALMPTFIVGPSALRTDILQVVRSIADPSAGNSITFNPANELQPVIEPLLDADSTTAWYLFAAPTRVETVEVTFLQGQEAPVTRDYVDEETLARNFVILQTFAAKALEHRGVQKHAGA